MSPGTAELIADRGAAASGEDFFRSPEFLDAECVTHTLRIEATGTELVAPLIVREIDGAAERDAISPYGYPGLVPPSASDIDHTRAGSMSDARLDPTGIDFSGTGLVSIFLRHTLGEPPLSGPRGRNVVQIADPALPPKSRGSDRNQINKNLRRGYRVEIVAGRGTSADQRTAFRTVYEQTMRRTGAADHYFFPAAYFDRILEAPTTWLALAHGPADAIAAASIAARSDGFLHYYLSGSADSHLRDSPMKNVVAALIEHAGELDLPLNLGGGISPGDRLEEFKRGFANREQTWFASELICHEAAYARLAGNRGESDFFPAYRASR